MLADQDDIWLPGRREILLASLSNKNVKLVCSNFKILDAQPLNTNEGRRKTIARRASKPWSNIIGILSGNRLYYGCTMAMKKDFLQTALPFPKFVESHDLWLALHANCLGLIDHISEPTVARRLHGENLTPTKPRSLYLIVISRILFLHQILISFFRKVKQYACKA